MPFDFPLLLFEKQRIFMKLLTTTTLLLISGLVTAEEYQSITNSSYSNFDSGFISSESFRLNSRYYFDKKLTLGPLDQFDYINKTSNVYGSYDNNSYKYSRNYNLNYPNGKSERLSMGGEAFVDNLVIGGSYNYSEGENSIGYKGNSKSGSLTLGYLFNDNFIVKAVASHREGQETSYQFFSSYNHQINATDYLGMSISTDEEFDNTSVSSKYFTKLGADNYLALRLSYADGFGDALWSLGSSYYFDQKTSVSVDYNSDDDYFLGVNYFINENVALNALYNSNKDSSELDGYSLGVTVQL
jgi:hypothetical protein